MTVRLPPLNSLRAFEAAARLGGFVKAASELNVTPAAVSHQIKTLEAHLGTAVFRRRPRGLALTDAGRSLLPDLGRGFAHLARAARAVAAEGLSGPLTISVAPSFAALWLVPRLGSFYGAYPEIELRLRAELRLADFVKDDVDLALRHGFGRYPGARSVFLMREEVFPVCAPSLLNRTPPLRRLADLRHAALLHDTDLNTAEPSLEWANWLLDGAGVDARRGPRFSDAILTTEAAVRGHGVALGRTMLTADHLAAGRLVRPFGALARPADFGHFAVTPEAVADAPKVAAFLAWLRAEIEASGGPPAAADGAAEPG